MDKQKALDITRDRIENMVQFIPSNQSEAKIAEETMIWLKFIEKMLDEEIKKDE